MTGFRINNVSEQCQPAGIGLRGAIDWTQNVFPIRSDGGSAAEGHWTGSDRQGDIEWTSWSAQVTGLFASSTSVAGTLTISDELNYKGQHFRCSTGTVKWSAALVG